MIRRSIALFFFLMAAVAPAFAQTVPPEKPFKALVVSKTTGFRHDSIPDGIAAVKKLGLAHHFTVDATEDAGQFTDAILAQYQVVIFLETTGTILNSSQKAAFQRYIEHGGGFAGVHSAADTEYDWPWYDGLIGVHFANHPVIQPATLLVADRTHPSTASLPLRWKRTDEWYDFKTNPRGKVHVLMTIDQKTYTGGRMGFDHPMSWCQEYDGGRAWYTALGHTKESYTEPLYLAHLLGGIQTAAGAIPADCGATVSSRFQKVVLDDNTSNPMQMSIAPDGRVFYVQRSGELKVYKPDTHSTMLSGKLSVTNVNEDGLLGVALDPGFAQNHWLYLFYSPAGAKAEQHLSRFTVNGNTLDKTTEKLLLTVPTQRQECCHSGGGMAFGPDGSLFVSLGDNTNPFASDGFDPIDEMPGRSPWDAQKSASNANDLRGKILRIQPQPDGTYTIPPGNLFPSDGSQGRPEIYIMGDRNPFRISVDSETGWLYWGEVGPDAQADNSLRGPQGYDEWNQARGPGNYGWPYCIADNKPYRDYDFATKKSGAPFSCDEPVNNSPNNTGKKALPPAQKAWIWYPYGDSAQFPELGSGGRTAMAGPVYHFDPNLNSANKLPAYYDKTVFLYEWSRNWIKEVKLDENGNILKINPFVPNLAFKRPMDMKLGPDGALYVIEWGNEFGGNNADSQLVRIDYSSGSQAPTAVAKAAPTNGKAPLTVQFDGSESSIPDAGDTLAFAWDFNSDGVIDSTLTKPTFTYNTPGNYTARLTVSAPTGKTGIANVPITVGNQAPTIQLTSPPNGSFFRFGDTLSYTVTGSDPEDGNIDCSKVVTQLFLGHNTHTHPMQQNTGCDGTFEVTADSGHGEDADLFLVLEATTTDNGAPGGIDPLSASSQIVLQPRRKQAEFFHTDTFENIAPTRDVNGGQDVTTITHGHAFNLPLDFKGVTSITYRVSSHILGGQIDVHIDSPDSPVISEALIPPGNDIDYFNVTAALKDPGGYHTYYFVAARRNGDGNLFDLNWVEFNSTKPGSDPQNPIQGDLNSDGTVGIGDAILALRMSVGLEKPTAIQAMAGDIDRNGVIDIKDAVALLRLTTAL